MRFGALAVVAMLAGCGAADSGPYTLYRSSPVDPSMRVHWATFDAAEGADYNSENCIMAADLLQENLRKLNNGAEPIRFWCEKGAFEP